MTTWNILQWVYGNFLLTFLMNLLKEKEERQVTIAAVVLCSASSRSGPLLLTVGPATERITRFSLCLSNVCHHRRGHVYFVPSPSLSWREHVSVAMQKRSALVWKRGTTCLICSAVSKDVAGKRETLLMLSPRLHHSERGAASKVRQVSSGSSLNVNVLLRHIDRGNDVCPPWPLLTSPSPPTTFNGCFPISKTNTHCFLTIS